MTHLIELLGWIVRLVRLVRFESSPSVLWVNGGSSYDSLNRAARLDC